jgi:tRNA (pseudouridine54-N1)-methyltransferase
LISYYNATQTHPGAAMRTFVLRARKGTVNADKVMSQVGTGAHFEIVAHTLANAFYFSNGMRPDVEVYVVLDSAADFPRTLKFSSNAGLSFPGFDEHAILGVVASALAKGSKISKDERQTLASGIEIFGFGFDTLMQELQENRTLYLLDKKGADIRATELEEDCVFLLSDHLPMPKNSIKVLERRGLKNISLGRKILFASQCVVLVHHELDRQFN